MPVHTIALWVAVGLLCLISARVVSVLYKYAGARVITCPENRQHAGVKLEVRQVLATGLASPPRLKLSSCSRWPERAGCGQECLTQIASQPKDCLVRSILSEWYADKQCIYCHQSFGDVQFAVQKPALLLAGKAPVACDSVPAERLLEVLATAKPVCFSCHTATSLVREHPDLVTDRTDKSQFGTH